MLSNNKMDGHFLREVVPIWGEVYKFKEWTQLWGRERNGTFVPILMHASQRLLQATMA